MMMIRFRICDLEVGRQLSILRPFNLCGYSRASTQTQQQRNVASFISAVFEVQAIAEKRRKVDVKKKYINMNMKR